MVDYQLLVWVPKVHSGDEKVAGFDCMVYCLASPKLPKSIQSQVQVFLNR